MADEYILYKTHKVTRDASINAVPETCICKMVDRTNSINIDGEKTQNVECCGNQFIRKLRCKPDGYVN